MLTRVVMPRDLRRLADFPRDDLSVLAVGQPFYLELFGRRQEAAQLLGADPHFSVVHKLQNSCQIFVTDATQKDVRTWMSG